MKRMLMKKTTSWKRKKATGIVGCSSEKQQHQVQLPYDLVFEVLTRVEKVKDLYQYRCVSKTWHSIITSPWFFEARSRHHPRGGMLLSVAKHSGVELRPGVYDGPVEVRFLYSTLLPVPEEAEQESEPEPLFCRSKVLTSCYFRDFTDIVNGLACVYEANKRVMVCNVCTGQTMRLPDYQLYLRGSKLFFGYDPAGRVYKLLNLFTNKRVCTVLEEAPVDVPGNHPARRCKFDARLECEILTLGRDSSWRKLDDDAGLHLVTFESEAFADHGHPVLVDGVMYWKMDYHPGERPILFSFDLNKETFRSIKPPQDPLVLFRGCSWIIVQFKGRPALSNGFIADDPRCILFHVLEDDEGDSWSSHSILLPGPGFRLGGVERDWRAVPVGNLPTGQILFGIIALPLEESEGLTHVYSYDHLKNKFERLVVGGELFPAPDGTMYYNKFTCIEENIVPLEVLFGGGELRGTCS